MIFLNSNFLLFMLIPLTILAFLIVTNKKEIDKIFEKKILKKLIIRRNFLGIFGKNILLFFALFMFVLALSRPVLPKEELKVKTLLPTYAILLDISASMLAEDIYPNRLNFAKKKIENLLQNTQAKIALYSFSDKLYQISPKTDDMQTLIFLIKHLYIDKQFSKSSNLYNALKHIKEKNIILFSDGTDIKDFSKFKNLHKNIIVYLTATKKGAPIKKEKHYLTNSTGDIVITKANQNISQIAKVINFSYKNNDISSILSSTKSISYTIKEFDELYYYPLTAGFIAFCFSIFSIKNIKVFMIILLLYTYPTPIKALFFDFLYIKKAKEAYQKKDYNTTIKIYKKLLTSSNKPELFYNLANAYYKNKNYKLALKAYKNVNTTSKQLRYKTYFNIANCYFQLKLYEQAFNFYNLAKSIKLTKKLEKNLSITQKYILADKKTNIDFVNIVKNTNKEFLNNIKIQTLMIPLTKGQSDENNKPW